MIEIHTRVSNEGTPTEQEHHSYSGTCEFEGCGEIFARQACRYATVGRMRRHWVAEHGDEELPVELMIVPAAGTSLPEFLLEKEESVARLRQFRVFLVGDSHVLINQVTKEYVGMGTLDNMLEMAIAQILLEVS